MTAPSTKFENRDVDINYMQHVPGTEWHIPLAADMHNLSRHNKISVEHEGAIRDMEKIKSLIIPAILAASKLGALSRDISIPFRDVYSMDNIKKSMEQQGYVFTWQSRPSGSASAIQMPSFSTEYEVHVSW